MKIKLEDDNGLTATERWLRQPWLAFVRCPPSRLDENPTKIGLDRKGDPPDQRFPEWADEGSRYVLSEPDAVTLLGTLLDALGPDGVLAALRARPELCASVVPRLTHAVDIEATITIGTKP